MQTRRTWCASQSKSKIKKKLKEKGGLPFFLLLRLRVLSFHVSSSRSKEIVVSFAGSRRLVSSRNATEWSERCVTTLNGGCKGKILELN